MLQCCNVCDCWVFWGDLENFHFDENSHPPAIKMTQVVITPDSIESSEETVSETTTTPSPPVSPPPPSRVGSLRRRQSSGSSTTAHVTTTSDSADSAGVAYISNATLVPTYEVFLKS